MSDLVRFKFTKAVTHRGVPCEPGTEVETTETKALRWASQGLGEVLEVEEDSTPGIPPEEGEKTPKTRRKTTKKRGSKKRHTGRSTE